MRLAVLAARPTATAADRPLRKTRPSQCTGIGAGRCCGIISPAFTRLTTVRLRLVPSGSPYLPATSQLRLRVSYTRRQCQLRVSSVRPRSPLRDVAVDIDPVTWELVVGPSRIGVRRAVSPVSGIGVARAETDIRPALTPFD